MGKMDEIIIVAPRESVFANESLTFDGVETNPEKVKAIHENIEQSYTLMRRGDAEEDRTFKQPIPYCVIRRGKEIFLYKRLTGGGEARLHNQLSIGAGGHMNDIPEASSFDDLLMENLNRELEEELDIKTTDRKLTTIGFINDDVNEVGKVHIGLLTILDIDLDGDVTVRETEQLEGKWISLVDLLFRFTYLETWSQIAVKSLLED